jgi:hypothetical protein
MLLGIAVSVLGGAVTVSAFLWALRKWTGIRSGEPLIDQTHNVPGWLTGCVERGVFTVLVAYDLSGLATAMVGWLAIKLAANWNNPARQNDPKIRAYAFSALLAGLLSMLFAVIGGMIARGRCWLY